MASKRRKATGRWEYTFKRAGLLERPLYLTFDSEAEGDAYAARIEQLLDRGIVPLEAKQADRPLTLDQLIRRYTAEAHPSAKDRGALDTIQSSIGTTPLLAINAAWVDSWITELKRVRKLAPATIRAKVGALARCCDWAMRKGLVQLPDHPLRTLPDGYAQYTDTDAELAQVRREDVERDRRLEAGELDRLLAVIASGVLPRKQRPRPLEWTPALRLLVVLAVESAMRLRELYTLTLDQVDIRRRTVFLDKTKNGDKRQVPLTTVAVAELEAYLQVRALPQGAPADLLFPWWSGSTKPKDLADVSDWLSKLFREIAAAAKCDDLKFHDLRHEATSRLFERTTLSEAQIMKITGHRSHRMMMRYANLRGSDLAARLW